MTFSSIAQIVNHREKGDIFSRAESCHSRLYNYSSVMRGWTRSGYLTGKVTLKRMKNSQTLAELSVQQLKRALEIRQKTDDLRKELHQLLGGEETAAAPVQRPRKRTMSAAARAKISAAQKARWADKKTEATLEKAPAKKKRKYSAEGPARFIAAAKARWAKYNAEKKKQNTPEPSEKAPAKKKRQYSPEGKARIIAGIKARWAKYNAEKKKKAAG